MYINLVAQDICDGHLLVEQYVTTMSRHAFIVEDIPKIISTQLKSLSASLVSALSPDSDMMLYFHTY